MPDLMVVAGGVRGAGGQDRANLERARYVAHSGSRRLTVVSNREDEEVHSFQTLFPISFQCLLPATRSLKLSGQMKRAGS
jgi:hypothetical protein